MRITAASIKNILRVRSVKITPDADQFFILIGGENAQGKSSVLNALTMAFGGKRTIPDDPVRHGAENGEVVIELDGGDLMIKLAIDKDGGSTLELSDRDGKLRNPQERLNKLVGSRTLDPIAFTLLSAADQRATLLKLIDTESKIPALDERRGRIFDKRTDVGRDLKKAEGEFARLTEVKVGTAIDVAALSAERAQLQDMQRKADGINNSLTLAKQETAFARAAATKLRDDIAKVARELEEMRARVDPLVADIGRCEGVEAETQGRFDAVAAEWKASEPRRAELDADIARAAENNRAVVEAELTNKRRAEAAEVVTRITAQRDQQTELLEKIDAQKLAILTAAKLPVEGLGIDDRHVTFNGVPFEQASKAEQMRVALAIAVAASPHLDDIWIKDGSMLDMTSLKLVADLAEASGKRLWIERVGDRDPGAIIIHDGAVRTLPSGEQP